MATEHTINIIFRCLQCASPRSRLPRCWEEDHTWDVRQHSVLSTPLLYTHTHTSHSVSTRWHGTMCAACPGLPPVFCLFLHTTPSLYYLLRTSHLPGLERLPTAHHGLSTITCLPAIHFWDVFLLLVLMGYSISNTWDSVRLCDHPPCCRLPVGVRRPGGSGAPREGPHNGALSLPTAPGICELYHLPPIPPTTLPIPVYRRSLLPCRLLVLLSIIYHSPYLLCHSARHYRARILPFHHLQHG